MDQVLCSIECYLFQDGEEYRALRKYRELTVLKNACYPLKYGNVYIRNIVYIESCGHLMIIQMADGKVIKQYGSLRVMEEGYISYQWSHAGNRKRQEKVIITGNL